MHSPPRDREYPLDGARTRRSGAPLWPWCLLFLFALPSIAAGQGRTATINGERLYYEVSGNGEPLVLIHGWSLSLRMWEPQLLALRRRFRVIRYDRRGFGRSSGSEDPSWDAADLKALLDSLGVRKVHLLGMSQGGRVAMQFARDYPGDVSSLILHGSSPPDAFGLPWTGPDRTRFDDWGKLAREQGLDAFRHEWAAHPLLMIPPGHPAARALRDRMVAEYRGGRFLNPVSSSGPGGAPTMEDLPRISVPTLVLIGEREVPYLQIVARALAYYMPNARLAVVPGGGHLVNLIEPDRYNATVLEFLAGLDRRRE